ncbi:GPI-anchor transamidase GPI17 [Sporobolomyces koalae]|uniref:GPI-anchor transamidase GPI17 n=1 Tax=Sporobolomyces koalae TaxID=500713 RepID=UPI00316DCC70
MSTIDPDPVRIGDSPVSPGVDVRQRRITLWSFLVMLVVGVPLWYNTTTLERRPLPTPAIRHWIEHGLYEIVPQIPADPLDSRVVKYSQHYKLVFSLLNQHASSALVSWDIQHQLEQHFVPLLNALEPLHNFTLESQIQYFAPLAVNLEHLADRTLVEHDDVRAFVNTAQWNLAAGTTLDPVLHFILYVPSAENRPLLLKTSDGSTTDSFITPQRGGLVIHDPSSSNRDLSDAFAQFANQFKLLVGLSDVDDNVDRLIVTRLRQSLQDTLATLRSLLNLVEAQPNMSIQQVVQTRIETCLDLLSLSRDTTDLELKGRLVGRAQVAADLAFFDQSMLPLLYFPQEHKYAVYMPLFGPVSVPLIVGLIREFKEWRKAKKNKARID